MLPLDCGAEFDPRQEQDFYAALPARAGVFQIESHAANAEPYLLRTANLRERIERLLRVPAEPTKRLNLREFAARVRYRVTGSRFEQSFVFYQHARAVFPGSYRDRMRLRPPALLKVNLRNAYPRCYVTRRLLDDAALYVGPFPSRKSAEGFANEFLNLYKVRRCQIKIRRDPSFPGCIYSEMKMCLAPCFAGCTKAEYDVEVARVTGFLQTGGASLVEELGREREAASEALDFERAAAVHKRVEKVDGILRGLPELARRVEDLDAVILQPAVEEGSIAVFIVRGGVIAEPFFLRFGELASQPRSVEEILRDRLEPRVDPSATLRAGTDEHRLQDRPLAEDPPSFEFRVSSFERADHLSLLARWFYGKPRTGEIFFPEKGPSARSGKGWPYRRILRACSRLLNPQPNLPGM